MKSKDSGSYNGANRPIRFRNDSTDTTVECGYDSQGRRYFKKVTVAGTVTLHHRYVYRGYLQIAALDLTRSAHPALWFVTWEAGDKHEKKDPIDVWFGLFRDDGSLNDKFYDKDRCKKRDGIRLHKGSLSYGCVTVFNGQEKLWSDIVSLIRSTKQGEPIRYGFCCRNKVFRYGTLIITSNNSKSETTSSSEEAEFLKKEKKYR